MQVDVFNAVPVNGGENPEEFERGLFNRSLTFAPVQTAEGQAEIGTPTPSQFFTFDFGLDEQPTYVYEVTYFHAESGPTFTGEKTALQGTVVLPRDGDSCTPKQHIVRENVDVDTRVRAA